MTRMLTRDERHMLSTALDVLRANVLAEPGRRRGQAGPTLYEALLRFDVAEDYGRRIEARAAWAIILADALRLAAWPYPLRRPKHQRRAERILRARLALAIRALLRADAGDVGRRSVSCAACGSRNMRTLFEQTPRFLHDVWRPACKDCGADELRVSRRITPWWQQPDMPAHGCTVEVNAS